MLQVGSATSFTLQYIHPLTDLPFIAVTPFAVQDIPVTYLVFKLRKVVTVVPGPCLLAFIHHYYQ